MSVEVIHDADIQAMKYKIEQLKRIIAYKDAEIDAMFDVVMRINRSLNHASALAISGNFLSLLNRGKDVI